MTTLAEQIPDAHALTAGLQAHDYLAEPGLSTALFCAVRLPQPLLLEGEAGVGKTQAAKSLAEMLNTPLIRLQCFEGIDASEALYEWNYPRQLLGIRVAEARGAALAEESLFSREYLIERPLLQALEHPGPNPAVLLIDEIDRADEEFEAFLFEMLAESSVTVPEIGTLRAKVPPVVHPMVRVHPSTGRKSLFINPGFTSHVVGLSRIESDNLLRLLYEHSAQPEFQVRHRWRKGDVLIWDNRATAHYAVDDYGDTERKMRRVTIRGTKAVGPNGTESHIVSDPLVWVR